MRLFRPYSQDEISSLILEWFQYISNTLMEGDWKVAAYIEGDTDLTGGFEGYDFSFGTDDVLSVSTNMNPVKTGLWRLLYDGDDGFNIWLNLGDSDDLFSELTEEWHTSIYNVETNRVELKHTSDDGTVTVLVFEK